MYKWKPPKKPPSFESGKELIEWYRKAYRLPGTWRAIKREITGELTRDDLIRFREMPKTFKEGVSRAVRDFAGMDPPKTSRPVSDHEKRMERKRVRYEKQLRQLRIEALKRVETDLKLIEKSTKKQPWLLRGALGKAAGALSLLIPSGTMIPDEEVDPWLKEETGRQALAQQTIRSYGPNLEATQKRRKGMKKGGKVSWNY